MKYNLECNTMKYSDSFLFLKKILFYYTIKIWFLSWSKLENLYPQTRGTPSGANYFSIADQIHRYSCFDRAHPVKEYEIPQIWAIEVSSTSSKLEPTFRYHENLTPLQLFSATRILLKEEPLQNHWNAFFDMIGQIQGYTNVCCFWNDFGCNWLYRSLSSICMWMETHTNKGTNLNYFQIEETLAL